LFSIESLLIFLEKVVESAPNTPLFYYHIPSMTGVTFPIDQFLVQASKRLSTFRGIKFSDGNLSEYSYCVAYENGQYNILYGQDEQLLAALSMGGTSAVGSTYNYCGKLNNELLEAFASGDITTALEKQRKSQQCVMVLRKYGAIVGHVGASKAIMKARGFDVGPPRLPLLSISDSDYSSLIKDLKSVGF
jgi:N-acetylneuraminate lyase